MAQAVEVEGLADLRKALRGLDKGALREVQKVTKSAAQLVATEAAGLAPHRSGRLSQSIKAATSGNAGIVRSQLPYAKVHEYGGTIRPAGSPITILRSEFIGRAQDRKASEVADLLARRFADLAARNGW